MAGSAGTVQLEVLRQVPLFLGLEEAQLEDIGAATFQRHLEKHELVLLESETADNLYIVASGVVKVYMSSPEGKEQILYLARPGEVVNEISILDGSSSPVSAEAMGQAVLYCLPREEFLAVLRRHPEAFSNVVNLLAARLRAALTLIADLSFRDVTSRLARLLLDHARAQSDAAIPREMLTQQDMAAMIGTAREMVGRSLKNLQGLRAIRMERFRIAIVNSELLERIATLG